MRASRFGIDGTFYFLGRRVPVVVGWLAGLTAGASILGVLGLQAGLPLFEEGLLIPGAVWAGEVWRLVTWVFLATGPLELVFTCLMFWWLGIDLANGWGPRRLLRVYLGVVASAALLTCLLARLIGGLLLAHYGGGWAAVSVLSIAWAVTFPSRDILAYFVLPIRGKQIVYFTVGMTVLVGLYSSFAAVLPTLLAEGLILAYVRQPTLARLLGRLRSSTLDRVKRDRPTRLREVKKGGPEEPPRWLH